MNKYLYLLAIIPLAYCSKPTIEIDPGMQAEIGSASWKATEYQAYYVDSNWFIIGRAADNSIISVQYNKEVKNSAIMYDPGDGSTSSSKVEFGILEHDPGTKTVTCGFKSESSLGIQGTGSKIVYKTEFPAATSDIIVLNGKWDDTNTPKTYDSVRVVSLPLRMTITGYVGTAKDEVNTMKSRKANGKSSSSGYNSSSCQVFDETELTITKHDLWNRYIEGTFDFKNFGVGNAPCSSVNGSFKHTYR